MNIKRNLFCAKLFFWSISHNFEIIISYNLDINVYLSRIHFKVIDFTVIFIINQLIIILTTEIKNE